MIDQRLLEILCCPETRQPLRLADAPELDRANKAIGRREVTEASGKIAVEPIEALLVRQDGKIGYAIRKGIPDLLKEDGLQLDSLAFPGFAASSGAKS
ncbi:MAG: Trm112 family protein [Fibrobacteres bacterium]|nr:Trm112 family protein [Fibrobacterota bacterium]